MRKPRQQSRDDRNLYVSNLDESIDDEALYRAFARFGIVTSVKVSAISSERETDRLIASFRLCEKMAVRKAMVLFALRHLMKHSRH